MGDRKCFVAKNVDTFFIMLGMECNLNCKYCLQHDLVEHPIQHDINPDIYDFIEGSVKAAENTIRIQFFGGEPLLFFGSIKEIVTELNSRGLNIDYSVITNGKAITQEMVDFFIDNNFTVGISWDGFNVINSRGFDVFKEGSRQRNLILQLPDLWITSVLSASAYPKELLDAQKKMDDEYMKRHGYHAKFNVDDLMTFGELPKEVSDIDLKRVESEVRDMAKEFIHDLKTQADISDHYTRNVYISSKYFLLRGFYKKELENEEDRYTGEKCCCGNGYYTLNLDLSGNLQVCHNKSTPIGTIYDNYDDYISKIKSNDTTHDRVDMCRECPAVFSCRGGCKLIEDKYRDTYCSLKRATNVPVLEEVLKVNKME